VAEHARDSLASDLNWVERLLEAEESYWAQPSHHGDLGARRAGKGSTNSNRHGDTGTALAGSLRTGAASSAGSREQGRNEA
jgi:hypothetical protein